MLAPGTSQAAPDERVDRPIHVVLVVAVMVSALSVSGTAYVLARDNAMERREATLNGVAEAEVAEVEAVLDGYEIAATLIAGRAGLRQLLGAHGATSDVDRARSMSSILADAVAGTDVVVSAVVADPEGRIVASSAPDSGPSLGDGPLGFDGSIETGEPPRVLSLIDDGTLRVFLRAPVVWDQAVVGVLEVEVDATELVSAVRSSGFERTGRVVVGAFDDERDVAVLVSPAGFDGAATGDTLAPMTATDVSMVRTLLGEEGTWLDGVVDHDGVAVLATGRHLPRVGWGLVVEIDRDEGLAEVRSIGRTLLALTLVSGGLALVAGFFLRRRLGSALADRRRAEERFASMFVSSPVALLEVDRGGVVRLANSEAADLLRTAPEAIVGRPIEEFLPESFRGQHRRWRRAYLAAPGSRPMLTSPDVSVVASDGTEVPVAVSLTPIELDDRISVVAGLFDLTERNRAARELERRAEELAATAQRERYLAEQLQRSNAELDKLATHAAHDMQEPLRKITTFCGRLETELGTDLDPSAADSLRRVTRAADRMRSLVQDLLDYARATTTSDDAAPVDLLALLDAVADGFEGDEAIIVVAGGAVEAWGNHAQLSRVFTNLIANAMKYRHADRRPEILVTVSETVVDGVQTARVEVADNGIGIDPQYSERIFGMFERLHQRSDYDGTGLGLAICQRIVDQHGGSISATGAEGRGATFVVCLPTVPLELRRQPRLPEPV